MNQDLNAENQPVIYNDVKQKNILDMTKNKPGITQNEIVEKLKLKQQNISYNLRKLVEKGKIRVTKQGKIKNYYLLNGC